MKPQRIVEMMLTTGVLALGACAHRWELPLSADGAYCVPIGKGKHSTCTTSPVPSLEADAVAKQFRPDPAALTVYVVRKRSADYRNQVPVSVDNASPVVTVPESFIRWRLAPGAHRLSLAGDSATGAPATQVVNGKAGEVLLVEVVGSAWPNPAYHWEMGAEAAKDAVRNSRLIADINMTES